MRVSIQGAALLAVVFSAVPARADEDTLRLTWTAPPGCPSTDDVRRATLRGRGGHGSDREALEADARVEQNLTLASGATWKVRLRTRRGTTTGEREIEATTCNGVAEATAVLLALALVPTDAAASEQEPATTSPRGERDAPPPSRSRKASHAVALGASVAGDAWTLPSPTIGGSLTLAWTPGRARVELDGRRWASQSKTLSAGGSGARFTMTTLGGRGCWAALRAGGFDLSPCAGADVFLIGAPGYGADTNFAPSATWVALTGGALARLSLTAWLALRARVEAAVPLARPTFVVQNSGDLHRPSLLGAATSLGVEVLFL